MNRTTSESSLLETDPAVIQAELERLLIDRRFSGARQMSAFLRYIVTQTLDGNAERIKAYTVGVDALGKPDSFDAQSDPSVRVLALRLRKTLAAAYEDNCVCHAKIALKVGTYVPEFYQRHVPLLAMRSAAASNPVHTPSTGTVVGQVVVQTAAIAQPTVADRIMPLGGPAASSANDQDNSDDIARDPARPLAHEEKGSLIQTRKAITDSATVTRTQARRVLYSNGQIEPRQIVVVHASPKVSARSKDNWTLFIAGMLLLATLQLAINKTHASSTAGLNPDVSGSQLPAGDCAIR